MIKVKEIDDYIKLSKTLSVNNEIKLLIENIIKPLLKSDVYFDKTTFKKCLDYCQKWYYELIPYQKFIYALFFFYDDKTKTSPRFNEIFLMMGRGNGKDGMFAPLADFFTTPMHGIKKYNVEIIGIREDITRGTFEIIYDRMEEHKELASQGFRIKVEEIKNYETRSKISFNSGTPSTGDSKRPGLLIVNEVHLMESYALLRAHQSARGKVPCSRTLFISTDGYIRGRVLDDYKELGKKVLNKEIEFSRFLPIFYKLDNEEEVDDPKNWEKANPSINYMPALKDIIKSEYDLMQQQPHLRLEFMTKRMDLPKEKEEQKFTTWENILATNREVPELKNPPAIFAIDYAEIKDFASCGFLTKSDDEYIWKQHSWANSRSLNFKFINNKVPLDDWEEKGLLTIVDAPTIDIDLIWDYFFNECKNYNTQLIVVDMFRFGLIRATAETRGLTIYDKKTNPGGEILLLRSGEFADNLMVPELDYVFANKKIIYGDDPLMRWYTNNTGIEQTKKGNQNFTKIEPKLRKNDGFQALRHAFSQRELLNVKGWDPGNNYFL